MPKQEFMYGFQTLREILQYQAKIVQRLYLAQGRNDERIQELQQLAQNARITITWVA